MFTLLLVGAMTFAKDENTAIVLLHQFAPGLVSKNPGDLLRKGMTQKQVELILGEKPKKGLTLISIGSDEWRLCLYEREDLSITYGPHGVEWANSKGRSLIPRSGFLPPGVFPDESNEWEGWTNSIMAQHPEKRSNADALASCRVSRQGVPQTKGSPQALASANLAIEAMPLHPSGDEAGARRALAEAKSLVEVQVPGIDADWWADFLGAYIRYREADKHILSNKVEPQNLR